MAGHAGLGHLSGDDIVDSRKFLRKVFRRQLEEAEAGKRKLTVAGEQPLQHLLIHVLCACKTLAKKLVAAESELLPTALPAAPHDDVQPDWRCADCGAGVGRVTEQLLLHHFATVDLIEPSEHLMGTARENLSSTGRGEHPKGHKAGEFFNMGLQAWTPEAGR